MKLLSIDIGSYSIKVVELDSTFGRIELSDYTIERVIEPEPEALESDATLDVDKDDVSDSSSESSSETQTNLQKPIERERITPGQLLAIQRILLAKKSKYDRLIVNYPKSWITTRLFTLPTKDRKTIQSTLAFELDDEIPFEIDKALYDFAILNSNSSQTTPQSTILAAVAIREDIRKILDALDAIGVDPDILTIEPWALNHLLSKSIPESFLGKPIGVLNFGSEKTSINLFVGNNPVMTHVVGFGGNDVTQAIAMTYNLSFDEADRAKIQGSFLVTQGHLESGVAITAEQKEFSNVIAESLAPILREIRQALLAYKSQYKLYPKALFLTGGSSLIPNLPLYLEEALHIPVHSFRYMSQIIGQTLQLSESTEAQISVATGLALSASKIDRNYSINFRKEEFTKRRGLGKLDLKQYKRPIQYTAFTLMFIFLNLFAQYVILSSRQTSQEERFQRSIKSVLGAVSPSVMNKYVASPTALKNAVKKELSKFQYTEVKPQQEKDSALDLLNTISQKMPKSMTLDVTKFDLTGGNFTMMGLVDSEKSSTLIESTLKSVQTLTELKKEITKKDPKATEVPFKFSAKLVEAKDVKN